MNLYLLNRTLEKKQQIFYTKLFKLAQKKS